MFDIGWTEMVLIIIVMIIVIGPKDLPRALHSLGQWVRKVRAVARQFQDSIEQMAQQSGIDDVRKEVSKISDFSIEDKVKETVDPKGELDDPFNVESGELVKPDGERPKKIEPAGEDTDKPAKDREGTS